VVRSAALGAALLSLVPGNIGCGSPSPSAHPIGSGHPPAAIAGPRAPVDYEPSVKAGNQMPLKGDRRALGEYLKALHGRIHPIFTNQGLVALDALPPTDPMNRRGLVAQVELVLAKDDGRIVRAGITKQSGVAAFDDLALESVRRAAPFGQAPENLVSPDGRVYVRWQFHRDPFDACSPRNAYPVLLERAPDLDAR
jgi:TonB family protein